MSSIDIFLQLNQFLGALHLIFKRERYIYKKGEHTEIFSCHSKREKGKLKMKKKVKVNASYDNSDSMLSYEPRVTKYK